MASKSVISGSNAVRRLANMVLPVPGGPKRVGCAGLRLQSSELVWRVADQ